MAEEHETQAMPPDREAGDAKHRDWRLGGKRGGGGSNGGAYPNPYTGTKDEAEEGGFGDHGGSSEMAYHGSGQLGEKKTKPGGNENAGARTD